MEKKITKRDVLEHIIATYSEDKMVVDYATHEIELLDNKKAKSTRTKTQVENDNLKEIVVQVLSDINDWACITDIQEKNDSLIELSNQKISALLKQLVDTKVVDKKHDKKKAYFKVA